MNKAFTYLLVGFVWASHSHAEFLTDNDFSFGKLAVTKNTSVSSVTMTRTGVVSSTGDIYVLEIGQPGVYTLTELPAYSVVSLSSNVPAYSASTIPGTQQFTISALDIPNSITVDSNGTTQFKVGGVLETSGLGGKYIGPATYQIMLDIDISY